MPKAKAEAPAAPIWFYHLERSSLDDVLPELVDRCLKRAWRVLNWAPRRDLNDA